MGNERRVYSDDYMRTIIERIKNGESQAKVSVDEGIAQSSIGYWLRNPPELKENGVAHKASVEAVVPKPAVGPGAALPQAAPVQAPAREPAMRINRVTPCPVCGEGFGWTVELGTSLVKLCDRGGMAIDHRPKP